MRERASERELERNFPSASEWRCQRPPAHCVSWHSLQLRCPVQAPRAPALTTLARTWTRTPRLAPSGRWLMWTCTRASRSGTRPSFTTRDHILPAIPLGRRPGASAKHCPLHPPPLRPCGRSCTLCLTRSQDLADHLLFGRVLLLGTTV